MSTPYDSYRGAIFIYIICNSPNLDRLLILNPHQPATAVDGPCRGVHLLGRTGSGRVRVSLRVTHRGNVATVEVRPYVS